MVSPSRMLTRSATARMTRAASEGTPKDDSYPTEAAVKLRRHFTAADVSGNAHNAAIVAAPTMATVPEATVETDGADLTDVEVSSPLLPTAIVDHQSSPSVETSM